MKGAKKKLLYYRRFLFSACGVCEAAKATCFGLGTSKRKRDCCEEPIFIFTGEACQPQSQAGQELTEACLWAGSKIICPSQPWWIISRPQTLASLSSRRWLCLFSDEWVGAGDRSAHPGLCLWSILWPPKPPFSPFSFSTCFFTSYYYFKNFEQWLYNKSRDGNHAFRF